ncbi:conjugal transfer protein TraG N-terminal domain-containing protein [Thorsellia anophelis]|uniref:Conjugal transfer mating pair stabilization protein TraG n=1 Tax=Thorsellia anophelis DSM 18579 TaxID=1123402 RepID=A0A1I0D190_9GAMM|nr:conjugal transfer protein TraG N-terminal domain-containing protein [Thorsellia anophelis]SET25679.1 conjugal transfer mating pair stabilization protein TraG [Thorsellia anophelis DSM 18579]
MWHIYSIGDSAFLAQVLNAVAMLTGTGDFITLVKIGFLIGVIFIAFKSILNVGKGIDFSQLLIAWIVFAISFGPTSKVVIEDVYTGHVQVVDNVPIGVASVGAIVSKIGFGLTELFEQAFSTPTMTQYGFASSLEALIEVRTALYKQVNMQVANKFSIGDMELSWYNYLKECTLIGVDIGQLSLASIMNHPSPIEAVKFDSKVYGTEIIMSNRQELMDCSEAYAALKAMTESEFIPKLKELLAANLSQQPSFDVDSIIRSSLNHLGLSTISIQNFMAASILLPIYEQAAVGKYQDEQAFTSAVMINQAILQRNTQWAAEAQLFNNIVRPMMTFFEGFIYAITPLMGFVIALGSFGINMTCKYLVMLLWIQLWMPLLAIINLYIHLSVNRKMSALINQADFQFSSFSGMQTLDSLLQTWIATGGMLASSVPAIALMLVYGSSVTATHLAGRLQNSDTIDEKILTPDLASIAPVTQTQSLYQTGSLTGTMKNGSDQLMSQFSVNHAMSNINSAANEELMQATTQFSHQLGQSLSKGFSSSHTIDSLSSIGESIRSSQSESSDMVNKIADDFQTRYGFSDDKQSAVRGLVTGVLSGNLSIGKNGNVINRENGQTEMSLSEFFGSKNKPSLGLKTGLAGQAESMESVGQAKSAQLLIGELTNLSTSDSIKSDFMHAMSKDISRGSRSGISNLINQQDESKLVKSAQDLQSASKRVTQIAQTSLSMQGQKQTDGATLTKLAASNSHVIDYLNQYMTDHPEAAGRMRSQLPLYQSLLSDDNQAYVAASLEALSYDQSHNPAERDNDNQAALNIMGMATSTRATINHPNTHRQMANIPTIGKQTSEIQANLSPDLTGTNQLQSQYANSSDNYAKDFSVRENELQAFQHISNKRVNDNHSLYGQAGDAMIEKVLTDNILSNQQGVSKSSQFFNAIDTIGKANLNYTNAATHALNNLGNDYKTYYQKALNDTDSRGILHTSAIASEATWTGLKSALNAGIEMNNPLEAFTQAYQESNHNGAPDLNWGTRVEAIMAGLGGAAKHNQLGPYLDKYANEFKLSAYQEGIAMGLTRLQSQVFAESFNEGIFNRVFHSQEPSTWSDEIISLRDKIVESYPEQNENTQALVNKQVGMIMEASLSGQNARNELIDIRAYNMKTHRE